MSETVEHRRGGLQGSDAVPAARLAKQDEPPVSSDRWFRVLAERTGDVFFSIRVEPDLAVEFVSETVGSWAGYSAADYMDHPELLLQILDPRDADQVTRLISTESEQDKASEVRWLHRDGRQVWTQARTRRRRRPDGSVVVEGTVHDITEQRLVQQALATTQEQYRLLAEESSDFTLRTVGDFVVEWVSPSVTAALGWKSEEIVGRSGLEFFHPNDVAGTVQRANEMSNGAASSGRIRLRCSDGGYRWFSQVARPVFDDEGRLVARISGFQDVDAEVRAERALARSERRFRLAMESAPTGMAVVDLDRCFLEVNPALCRMLRRDEPWVLARSMADVLAADEVESDERMHADVLTGQTRSARAAKRLITADGDHVWVEHSLGLLSDDDGRPVSFVSQFLDVTAAHQAQERLRFLADHDVLTSLANRHQLLDRVGAILGHRPRMGGRLAILFVDLDNFKPINDTYGHAAGDVVLVEVARRITSAVRSDDVVARIGGDEFVVAMSPVRSVQDAESVAGKLHMQLKPAISIGGAQVTVGASIGLTLAEPGDDADRLLKRADEALYLAKSQGRNRTVVHQGTQEP